MTAFPSCLCPFAPIFCKHPEIGLHWLQMFSENSFHVFLGTGLETDLVVCFQHTFLLMADGQHQLLGQPGLSPKLWCHVLHGEGKPSQCWPLGPAAVLVCVSGPHSSPPCWLWRAAPLHRAKAVCAVCTANILVAELS